MYANGMAQLDMSIDKRKKIHRQHEEKRQQLSVFMQHEVALFFVGTFVLFCLIAILFSKVESISFADAIYFVIVSATTVGYGDVLPTKDTSKLLVDFVILLSIFLFASTFGMVQYTLEHLKLEWHHQDAKETLRKSLPVNDKNGANISVKNPLVEKKTSTKVSTKSGDIDSIFIHKHDSHFQTYKQLYISLFSMVVIIFFGVVVHHVFVHRGQYIKGKTTDHYNFNDGLYFAIVTATTVGYGDLSPERKGDRIAVMFYILFSTSLFAVFLSRIISAPMNMKMRAMRELRMSKAESSEDEMGALLFHGGEERYPITANTFILWLLMNNGDVNQSKLKVYQAQFETILKHYGKEGQNTLGKKQWLNLLSDVSKRRKKWKNRETTNATEFKKSVVAVPVAESPI